MSTTERRITLLPEDQGVDLDDHVSSAVVGEQLHHPKPISRRGGLIEIQETFGYEAHPIEVAHLLGITEKEIRRYLSRRGIRDTEFEAIQERYYDLLTIARITKDIHPGPHAIVDRRAILSQRNHLFDDFPGQKRNAFDLIKIGQTHRVVSVLQNTLEFQKGEHPDST